MLAVFALRWVAVGASIALAYSTVDKCGDTSNPTSNETKKMQSMASTKMR